MISANPDTRKYCLAVGVFCFRAGNGIPLDCGQPSDKYNVRD